jgi:nucleoside-diphosphate-sugar epimerase
MRVLVTGHRGYVGCLLVPMLQSAGHEVTGYDSDLYRACDFGGAPEPVAGIDRDIRDVSSRDIEGQDAVIHLAGLSNDPLGDLDPSLTRAINTEATLALGRAAKAAGVGRFLFSSSCSNYGAAPGDGWLTEEASLNPVTPYAVSKVESEEGLDRLADDAFCPVFLRSGTAYGFSPRIRFDLVVNNLTAWAMATGEVRLKSDGSAWRPLVHAADMALAFLTALEAPRDLVHRQAFNVGRNADCMRIRDLAEIVQAAIPGSAVTFSGEVSADKRTYRVDCTKIARTLGYAPRWTVEKGVAELRDAFTRHGVGVADFEGARYQRVAHIRHLISEGQLGPDLRRVAEAAHA